VYSASHGGPTKERGHLALPVGAAVVAGSGSVGLRCGRVRAPFPGAPPFAGAAARGVSIASDRGVAVESGRVGLERSDGSVIWRCTFFFFFFFFFFFPFECWDGSRMWESARAPLSLNHKWCVNCVLAHSFALIIHNIFLVFRGFFSKYTEP
jgi:hypothetical protein